MCEKREGERESDSLSTLGLFVSIIVFWVVVFYFPNEISGMMFVCKDEKVCMDLLTEKKDYLCLLCLSIVLIVSTDSCENVNCNYGRCLTNRHDGTPYCECMPGYVGVVCLDAANADNGSE